MSFADQLVLWLHVGFAVFTVGPVTLAISSTPRYIRKRDLAILRYLTRITMIFAAGSLGVLILGIAAGQLRHELSKPWLTAAMTLFLVALVLLVLIIRDQRKAIRALEAEAAAVPPGADQVPAGQAPVSELAAPGPAGPVPAAPVPAAPVSAAPGPAAALAAAGQQAGAAAAARTAQAAHVASVERGRIAAMGGVVNLIWLAVLALMVWQP